MKLKKKKERQKIHCLVGEHLFSVPVLKQGWVCSWSLELEEQKLLAVPREGDLR